MRRRRGHWHLGARLALVMGTVGGVAMASAHGPIVTPDGVSYLRMAQGLGPLEGHGNHFPGGYPAVLWLLGALGFEPLDAARWLGVALAGVNLFLAGVVVRRMAGDGWAVVVALVLAVATPIAWLHPAVLSEPLFFTVMLLWLLAAERASRSSGAALGAGVLAAAAVLVRFAGASLVIAGLVLLVRHRRQLGAYAAGAGVPIAIWIGAMAVRSSQEARTVAWHPSSRYDIVLAARSVATWVLGRLGPELIGVAVAAAAVWLLWEARRAPGGEVLGVTAVTYLAVLGVTVFLLDAQTPLDPRLLSPVQLLVILALPAVPRVVPRALVAVGLAGIVLLTGVTTVQALRHPDLKVLRAARGEVVRASATLDGPVWSNGPGALWLGSGRDARPLPMLRDPWSLQPNRHYGEQMADLRRSSGALVVWVDYFAYRDYLASRERLVAELDLQPIEELPDGVVYRVP